MSADPGALDGAGAGTTHEDAQLVRAVGVGGLAANIVNLTVGGGIFRAPAVVFAGLGAAAPAAYLVCVAVMALVVICFAQAGSRVSLTGGLYAYAEVAFGPFVGFVSGVLLWTGFTIALAAVATLLADALGALLPVLAAPLARATLIVAVLGAVAVLNVRGVALASRVNVFLTIVKMLPLFVLVGVGAFFVRGEHLAVAEAPSLGALARGSAFLMLVFLGVEAALIPSGEVKDPARTIPRAIFLAMAVITVFYLAIHAVVQGILGPALAGQLNPLSDAAGVAFGPAGQALILAAAGLSMLGYVAGATLAVPRMLFAFARDGFLPRGVAAVHERFRTPHVAIAAQMSIVTVLALTGTFEWLAIVSNGSILLVYAACCLAAWELRRRDVRAGGVPFQVPGGAVIPWVAFGAIVWLLGSLERNEWAMLIGVVGVATVLFFAARGVRGGLVRGS